VLCDNKAQASPLTSAILLLDATKRLEDTCNFLSSHSNTTIYNSNAYEAIELLASDAHVSAIAIVFNGI
jgi:hypothetical protein